MMQRICIALMFKKTSLDKNYFLGRVMTAQVEIKTDIDIDLMYKILTSGSLKIQISSPEKPQPMLFKNNKSDTTAGIEIVYRNNVDDGLCIDENIEGY
jgi:hypothetical protein